MTFTTLKENQSLTRRLQFSLQYLHSRYSVSGLSKGKETSNSSRISTSVFPSDVHVFSPVLQALTLQSFTDTSHSLSASIIIMIDGSVCSLVIY